MAVHSDSVIPVWLSTYKNDVYVALTNQEEWTYTHLEDAVIDPPLNPTPEELLEWKEGWIAEFTKIAAAFNSWRDVNRETAIADVVSVLFGVKTLQNLYNFPLQPEVYTPDSFITLTSLFNTIKSRPIDFYKDYNLSTMESVKIETDVNQFSGAGTAELNNLIAASRSLASSIKPYSHKLIFEEVPIVGVSSKKLVRDYIFDELGYANYYSHLNVGVLEVPPPLE